jgi:hypothetical protein
VRALFTFAIIAVLALCAELSASAYVCTRVPMSSPEVTEVWDQRCIPYFINANSSILGGTDRRALVAQCFATWSNNACTDLDFVDEGYTSEGASFNADDPYNQENVIKTIESSSDPDYAMLPDGSLLALTLTSFSRTTGEIFDADIMVNAVQFTFIDVTDEAACLAMGGKRPYDLRNTLTHEMGHFIGFDHDPDPESTMFASAQPCETKKRDLTAADLNGLCTIYSSGQPPHTCEPPPGGYDPGAGESAFRNQCDRSRGQCRCRATPPARSDHRSTLAFCFLIGAALIARRVSGSRPRRRSGARLREAQT